MCPVEGIGVAKWSWVCVEARSGPVVSTGAVSNWCCEQLVKWGAVEGKGLVLGLIVAIVALWGVLMFSLTSGSTDDGNSAPPCLAQENC